MKWMAIFLLYIIILLPACTGGNKRIVEVTRVVPQTVQVTVISTFIPSALITQSQVTDNTVYFEGMATILQYYKLLDQGRYEDAYLLLGASAKEHAPNLDDYVASTARAYKRVKVIDIQPLNEWAKASREQPLPDPDLNNIFYVQIVAAGEGGMSGSAVNGQVQTLFIAVTQEDGAWKIDSWATGIGR